MPHEIRCRQCDFIIGVSDTETANDAGITCNLCVAERYAFRALFGPEQTRNYNERIERIFFEQPTERQFEGGVSYLTFKKIRNLYETCEYAIEDINENVSP